MKKEKIGLMMQYQKKNYNIFSKIDDCFPYTSEDEFMQSFKIKDKLVKLYCVEELNYEDKMPRVEAFENVLTSIYNFQDYNFVYILKGNRLGIKLYLGLAKNIYKKNYEYKEDFAELIKSSIFANFPGTKFKNNNNEISKEEKIELISNIENFNEFNMIAGVPEFNIFDEKSEQNKGLFQGIDRLIRAMSNEEWALMIVAESVNKEEILREKEKIYSIYNELYPYSKKTIQMNESKSIGITKGESTSENKGNQVSKNDSMNKSRNDKESETVGETKSSSNGSSTSKNNGISTNKTDGNSETIDFQNKKIIDNLEYLEKKLIKRNDLGNNRGFFKTAIYTFANEKLNLKKLNSNLISIFQGESGDFSALKQIEFENLDITEKKKLQKYLLSFQTFNVKLNSEESVYAIINSIPTYIGDKKSIMGLSTYLTAREISLLSGFPLKEVSGIKLKKGIDFGLNIPDAKTGILIGNLLYRGNMLNNNIFLDEEHLNKHIFITGVTGSGKTTTSQKILIESKLPFIVIEPAKTEYRRLYNVYSEDELEIYSLGSEDLPFRLNPFEIIKGEKITSHIDLVKAAFIASFPMEAAMPYILEEAMYKIYEDKGWNINLGINEHSKDPWNCQGELWPNMSDLLTKLEEVIKSKHFGYELEANYRGSLIARFSNFTIGSKGKMLNCRLSTDFNKLIEKRVILELEELKDSREKSLMMALVLSRLSIIVKEKYKEDNNFKHITLIEEAHRLLSKIEYGDEGSKKIGVEIFTDILAEIRKYGESLIIVDQIPNKLTPEVLKNTSTKIVHKIFAQDDKDAIGNTMLLSDEQKEYLSIMKTGEAIMFSQDWDKAVNIMINRSESKKKDFFNENTIVNNRMNNISSYINILFPYIDKYKNELKDVEIIELIKIIEQLICLLKKMSKEKEQEKSNRNEIIKLLNGFENKEVVKKILLETVNSTYLNFELKDNDLEKRFLDIFNSEIEFENIEHIKKILGRL